MIRRALTGVLSLAFLAACAPTPPPAPAAPPAAPAAAPAAPAPAPAVQTVPGTSKDAWYVDPTSLGFEKPATKGGIFTFTNTGGPPNLNPFGPNLTNHAFLDSVYESLLARSIPMGKNALAADIICRLCDSWEVKADKLTYTFKLRQNVKFHDGQPFTAEDVKFSLEKAMNPDTGFEFRSSFAGIEKMETPDKYTIILVTKAVDADFLRALGWGILPIVPKHAYESGVDMIRTVVGTGPFKMEKFDPVGEFVAVRNPDFWLPDRPYLDKIHARFIADFSTRQAAFATKQIDAITADNAEQMKPTQAIVPTMQGVPYDPNHSPALRLNLSKAPFNDKRVRQAIHLAIDRDEMNKQLTGGNAEPYGVPGTPAAWLKFTTTHEELAKLPGFRQPKDQDLAEAKRLMAAAGYANGFKATSAHQAGQTHNPEWNESIGAQLKKIGIDVTIDPGEAAVFVRRERECSYDMWLRPSAGTNSMPTRNYAQWITGGSENFCKFSNAEYDKLFTEQSAELDANKRWAIVKKLQAILLEELPMIHTVERATFAGWHPYLHNWRNYGSTWTYPLYPTAELIWTEKK